MPTRCLIAGLRRFRTGRCRGACPHCSGQCRGETMWGADILVVRRIRPPPCRCLRAFPGAAAPTQLRRCPVCSGSDRSGPRSSMTPGPAPHRHGCGVPPLLQPNSSRATAPRCAGRLRDEPDPMPDRLRCGAPARAPRPTGASAPRPARASLRPANLLPAGHTTRNRSSNPRPRSRAPPDPGVSVRADHAGPRAPLMLLTSPLDSVIRVPCRPFATRSVAECAHTTTQAGRLVRMPLLPVDRLDSVSLSLRVRLLSGRSAGGARHREHADADLPFICTRPRQPTPPTAPG